MIRIKKDCSDRRIEQIQDQNKAISTVKDCDPSAITLCKNY